MDKTVAVRMLCRASSWDVVQSFLKLTWNLLAKRHGICTRTYTSKTPEWRSATFRVQFFFNSLGASIAARFLVQFHFLKKNIFLSLFGPRAVHYHSEDIVNFSKKKTVDNDVRKMFVL